MKKILITVAAVLLALTIQAKDYKLTSPDGKIVVTVQTGAELNWSIQKEGAALIEASPIGIKLTDGTVWGAGTKFRKAARSSCNRTLKAQNFKRSEVKDNYNELKLSAKAFDLIFRVYDDGAAYRFVTKKATEIENETATFNFPDNPMAWIPYVRDGGSFEDQFFNSFENVYNNIRLREWNPARMAFLPLTVESAAGPRICITEADLLNYPGMYLANRDGDSALEAMFAGYPKTIVQGGHNMLQGIVTSRENYIYKCDKAEPLPWRVVVITDSDAALADNDLVWRLAKPAEGDFSWVKPGKVAWDWWNDWNIKGVDFASGINNDTYKYYIDFASKNGIEYVILDEGWAVNLQADLMQIIPEIDLPMLSRYAIDRGVRLVLWAGYWAFNRDIEGVCKYFSEMGIAGFKVDFMNRDDQQMVAFYEEAARIAAKYHLFLDFHGAFKPAGLTRTWPNVLNFEGINGLEQLKWMGPEYDQVTYDVTVPFTRYVAGPADYTQGAMRNAIKANYYPCDNEPMSQGTRCRQLAEYIIFDAPFTMLCDAPTNYEAEPECTGFIASVPTVWDETIALDGRIGDYIVMARRSGSKWYLAAMTDWDARDITIKLPFEAADGTKATLWRDGVNAHRNGQDYRKEAINVSGGEVKVHLAPGGGCVVVF